MAPRLDQRSQSSFPDAAREELNARRHAEPVKALQQLIEWEDEAVAALHAVIADTGEEPRSEALEHMLEHEIMRKQQQLDRLRRAAD